MKKRVQYNPESSEFKIPYPSNWNSYKEQLIRDFSPYLSRVFLYIFEAKRCLNFALRFTLFKIVRYLISF